MTSNINISGVLVHARPELCAPVTAAIEALSDVEIQAVTDEGRFVVTIETQENHAGEKLLALQNIQGVLSAALVYSETYAPSESEAIQ